MAAAEGRTGSASDAVGCGPTLPHRGLQGVGRDHGAAAKRGVVGGAHAEGGQRHGSRDHRRPLVSRDADPDPVADLLAQLAQGHQAQLDLAGTGQRVAAGGGGLHRAELTLQAERRDDLPVHRKLREREFRPAGHGWLVLEQPVHRPRVETPVASLGLYDEVPVPAVPGRM